MSNHREYPDIRVVRTRSKLREALTDLLQNSAYAAVNVTDIARTAGVNRITFYNHYSAKDELISEILDLQLDSYISLIDRFNPYKLSGGLTAEIEQFIRINFEHFDQYAKVYKILLSGEFPDYSKRFIEMMQESIRHVLSKMMRSPELNDEDYIFMIEWMVGGTMWTIRNFINNDSRPSVETISKRMIQNIPFKLLK
ncbi:TetR/AcrR family transcriptional regulator [Brevibacillus sp. B_LB10_24]|uniref:TetR/AcrR family transcriptional regulator n=1 Tax=Brevibacillus sp. B_LB10_24 TaxID=3380645 RepID=UPI0038B7C70B